MPDREKVIKGLEYCIKSEDCRGCIYWEEIGLHEGCPLNSEALELLKEQEVAKPITEHHLFLCPVCKNTLFREQKFCHECGKRIEWEGR